MKQIEGGPLQAADNVTEVAWIFWRKSVAKGGWENLKDLQTSYLWMTPQSGKYYADCREKQPKPQGQDDETAKKLWDITEKAVGL